MKRNDARYWSNDRKKNAKKRKDGVQSTEACHRGMEETKPVGGDDAKARASRGEQEQGRVVKGNVETKRLPAVPVFFLQGGGS